MTTTVVLGMLLALAAVSLVLGAVLGFLTDDSSLSGAMCDGFATGAIPSVVLLRVVPELFEQMGYGAVVLAAAGYGTLWLAELRGHGSRQMALPVVALALGSHALFDGAALSLAVPTGGGIGIVGLVLATAIIGHRLPEGLIIGRMLSPLLGARRTAMMAFGLGILATLGACITRSLHGMPLQLTLAVGMGALLRIVAHRPLASRGRVTLAARVAGAAAGCAAALAHHH